VTAGDPQPGSSVATAVVGVGAWGRNHARVLSELGSLAGVHDPDPAVAAAVARETGGRALTWAETLGGEVQALVIAAPAASHYSLAREALEAGKHVLVEKPLALRSSEGEDLVGLAEHNGRILMVGHLMRYHPAFICLRGLVDEGRLGQVRYIHSTRLNLGRFRTEESILWSFAPHDVSMILALTGSEPDRVQAVGGWFLGQEVPDVSTTQLWFAGGVQAHIFVSWLHPVKEQRLVVVGEDGMAVLDDSLPWDRKLQVFGHRVEWTAGSPQPVRAEGEPVAVSPAEPLREELTAFLRHCAAGTPPPTDGGEGLRVLRVLERAEASILESRAAT
jgi:UDP-2-acetamido-3-amino-2,3-dideoxy-glucuronate N-acetyltransferase